jgi:hypothetical protein
VCLSWLKTINTNYNAISGQVSALIPNPYAPLTISKQVSVTPHSYSGAVVNPSVPSDLAQVYERYFAWDWP